MNVRRAASEFLASKRVAVTGVSRNPKGHGSNVVYQRLRQRGYEVFAVNPNAAEVEGDPCYRDLSSIPGGVDAVVIATGPETAGMKGRVVRRFGSGRVSVLGRKRLMLLVVVLLLVLTSCAAGPNAQKGVADSGGQVAGFWLGLWQGIISPITFVISLFSNDVNVYEIHNNGNWYNFGFVLGAGILLGGGGTAGSRRRH